MAQPEAADQDLDIEAASGKGISFLQLAGIALVLVLGAVFVYANRSEAPAAWDAALAAQPIFLAAAAGLTVLYMLNHAAFMFTSYRAVGLRVPYPAMLWLSLGSMFVNMVSKSGGMGGLALYLADGRRRSQSRAMVVTAYVLAALLGHVAFGALLVGALITLWVDGRLTGAELGAAAVFVVYIGVQAAIVLAAVRSKAALRTIHALPSRFFARLRRLAGRPRAPSPPSHDEADELYDAVHLLGRRPKAMIAPAICALLVEILGVLTIWAVLRAFGQTVGLQAPLVAYAISVLFSIVGVLPAGIGFAEASLATVFTSFDVPGSAAAVAVITYRLFEVWIPFAIGAFAAQHLARKRAGR